MAANSVQSENATPVPADVQAVMQRAQCLFDEAEVEQAIDSMAQALSSRLAECNPILISVLSGALTLTTKLHERLDIPHEMDSLHATRYCNNTRGGELQWLQYPALPLAGRTLVIVDDILDEGITLAGIVDYCKSQGCGRVYSAVLINKIHNRKLSSIKADFIGLDAEDFYLFGYGMDYKGYLRDAPGVFAVAPEDL